VSGSKAQAFIQANAAERAEDSTELKGQIAHGHGKTISGPVRYIPVAYDGIKVMERAMAAMKKGKILVAAFTAPELMMACKKSQSDYHGLRWHVIPRRDRQPGIEYSLSGGNQSCDQTAKNRRSGDNRF
jgi:hypothetical protein